MKEGARIGEQYARRLTYVLATVWVAQVSGIGLLGASLAGRCLRLASAVALRRTDRQCGWCALDQPSLCRSDGGAHRLGLSEREGVYQ